MTGVVENQMSINSQLAQVRAEGVASSLLLAGLESKEPDTNNFSVSKC